MAEAEIGIIGGSGFYKFPGLEQVEEVEIATPFGMPSDKLILGVLGGRRVAFVARHGRGHTTSPSELPVRANFWALKSIGVQRVISVSAVGSMKQEIAPTHLVIPDQIIDRTLLRPRTFFGEGLVVHVALADPYCADLRESLIKAAQSTAAPLHQSGTYICIEGPQFSTRAESMLYRSWGVSVIGMTCMPEARLAREAEICYANLALATDYDSWHEEEEDVNAALVMNNLSKAVQRAQATIAALLPALASQADSHCHCSTALDGAIMSAPDNIPAPIKERLAPILARYLGNRQA